MSEKEGWYPGKILKGRLRGGISSQKLTLSQIDIMIHDIIRYIDDEKTVERLYRMDSQNPVIREIGAANIFIEIADDEKQHAQQLEALLPKLREKWSEVQQTLV